ncbi:parathyroid hormone 1a [Leucoraja erinacea]|uniref:parathyroid hormone 1a n=1 Tax=Leucoraja erinaceus TaxID=7782 RepID=UPI00245407E5|nr:parathyroid hormone 1a [Leucoraja erinacea]
MGSLGIRSQSQGLIVLCTLCTALLSESRPIRRSVSEMQLMHDMGRHLYDSKRQELIKDVVRDVHTASEKHITPYTESLSPKHPRSCKLSPAVRRQQSRAKSRRPRNSEKEGIKSVSADDFSDMGTPQDLDSLPKTPDDIA